VLRRQTLHRANAKLNFQSINHFHKIMKSLLLCSNTITPKTSPLKLTLKWMLSIAVVLITTLAQAQQTGSITGSVKTSDGKPAEYVTVALTGTSKGASVNSKGNYTINKVSPGKYIISASFIGLITQSKQIEVKAAEVLSIDFLLSENDQQLQEVIIQGSKNKFTRESSATVAKMPLKNLENPQVYTTVTKEVIQEQQIVTYSDIIKNVPGVNLQLQNNSNAPGGTVSTRGFSGGAFLRNGVPGMTVGILDPVSIETLEAIKGPSGALFGSSLTSFGGLFNRVTKKPFDTFQGNVCYTAGSYGLSRFTLDLNTPLNDDKSLLFRVTGAKHYEGSFQDAGFLGYTYIAPSLTYKASDKMTIYLDAEYLNGKNNGFYRLFVDASNATGVHKPANLPGFDFGRRFVGDDMASYITTGNFFAQVDYQLASNWKSQTNFSYSSSDGNGASAYLSMQPGNLQLSRTASYAEYIKNAMTDVQQNFTGDVKIGGVRNRLLFGLDYLHNEARSSSGTVVFDVIDVIDAVNPGASYSALNRTALLDRFVTLPFTRTANQQNTYSAYAQDVINITDQLMALLSARVDRFQQLGTFNLTTRITAGKYSQTAFSPKLGLVYQPVKDVISVFANYMNGFQNVAPFTQPDQTISVFKPQKANQFEGGAKFNLLNGKLSSNISYYNIKVSNVVLPDPDLSRAGFNIQNGTQLSKGFEADITANPIQGLNIIAGYAYNDSKLTKAAANVNGLRPGSAGPAKMANAWVSYRLSTGNLQGLGLGFGGNYASENIVNLSTTSLFTLPAYTVLNASIFYDKPKYRVGLKANNINNEKYFIGWGTTIPQVGRNILAEFTLKFGGVK
jgi:iron complex outermembrane receptor protein